MWVPGTKGAKIQAGLEKDSGCLTVLHLLKGVQELLHKTGTALPSRLSTSDVANVLFALITSANMERTFSMFKLRKENFYHPFPLSTPDPISNFP